MPNDLQAGGPRRRWFSHPILLTGTAVLAVAAGAGIALAATSAPSSSALSTPGSLSASNSSPAPKAPRAGCARVTTPHRSGVLCRRHGRGRFGLHGALHGTLVLPKQGGGTVTAEIQNGKVTSVSQSSITLKSTDGFTKTYTVTASTNVDAQRDGIGSVKAGDQVWVAATVSGGTVTAVRVMDISQLRPGLSNIPRVSHQPAASNAAGMWSSDWAATFSGGSAGG
ncbi:MAG TPA: hypothetical protein VGI74_10190 [Streptosporangiaceae bacterium]|jgi:hypothetical protein